MRQVQWIDEDSGTGMEGHLPKLTELASRGVGVQTPVVGNQIPCSLWSNRTASAKDGKNQFRVYIFFSFSAPLPYLQFQTVSFLGHRCLHLPVVVVIHASCRLRIITTSALHLRCHSIAFDYRARGIANQTSPPPLGQQIGMWPKLSQMVSLPCNLNLEKNDPNIGLTGTAH